VEVVGRGPPEPRKANACEFPWQVARLKVLATDVTIRQGGRVEIHTESWVDEAGSHRFQSVVVHGKLRRFSENQNPRRESIVHFPIEEGDTIIDIIERAKCHPYSAETPSI